MVKKYSLFKLWGSYAGALIYTLIPLFLKEFNHIPIIVALLKTLYFPFLIIFKIVPCNDWGCLGLFFGIYIILAPIIGFFAGYWIHRLFKR